MYVEGAPALNRVRWAHSGKEIATGDSEGQVQVYDVGEVRRLPFLLFFGYFHNVISAVTTKIKIKPGTFFKKSLLI